MFSIDRANNRISKLAEVKFGEHGISEREHLQEWIAKQPDALGEPLLIIQKEFAGWDDTKERLDLLAIDQDGFLVVIENKLDDSGRDVVWQALKYASYCSALSKSNVVEIFQRYLEGSGQPANAQERICEFLDETDFEEVRLNPGNTQRIILVSGQFRKEVTSTVLWLAKHEIDIKCFKATPFLLKDQLLLNLEQIIPLKEAEGLMIGMAKKEAQESSVERAEAKSHTLRRAFSAQTLKALEEARVTLFANVKGGKDHWIQTGYGMSGAHYNLIYGMEEARVEFVLDGADAKHLFDALYYRRLELESRFDGALTWRRMDDNRASIVVARQAFDGTDRAVWPAMIQWLVTHIRKLDSTFAPEIAALRELRRKMPTA